MVEASPPTLGLALSGGGYRGVAHVGFIKVLREADIPLRAISGSSAGALTAFMTAAGCSIEQMLDFWTEASPFSPSGLAMSPQGLFAADSFAGSLQKYVQAERFEDLDVPLIVALTALVRGEVEYRSEGELLPAVLASSAYPLLFTPVEIDDELYVDGGVTDNLPALPLRERCSHVIGIDVSPSSQPVREDLQSTMGVAQRVFDLLFDASVAPSRQHCDLVIAPPQIRHHPTFSNRDLLEVFRLGEEAARASLPDIQHLLSDQR